MKEKIDVGKIDHLCDNDQFRAQPTGTTQVQRQANQYNVICNKRSTIQHLLKEHLLGATSIEEIEVKLLSFPSSGSQSWGRKIKSSQVLCDIKETFVYLLMHIHRSPAT